MAKHLPFNEFDIAGITNAVSRYKGAGLRADYNIDEKAAGIVRIVFENPMAQDGSLVVFDIHKVARPGWFGDKAHWVVQLSSKQVETNALTKHGCVRGQTQSLALLAADVDLKHGFLSVADFELASEAY
ncbi:MAG: hypothetical protein K2Y71_06160 [Xanthobacteraceae bacterium]|nr:hypothetical protein [Xanthobacteraceae bacterium]